MVQRDQVPEDVMDRELWLLHVNALEDALLGGEISGWSVGQTDYGFLNDESLPADGEVSVSVRAPGGDRINGQAQSTGQWTLAVRWLDENDAVIREEGISSNTDGNQWANFSLDPKSPFADIVIYDDSGAEQTADLSVHYK